jgi:hypothetical protein
MLAQKDESALCDEALGAGWEGLEIAERYPLDEIARAHEAVERSTKTGRVVITT